jgi:hypothetical protein
LLAQAAIIVCSPGVYRSRNLSLLSFCLKLNQVRNNVFFNGPRAAINFNDGFLGGEVRYLRTRLPG